MNKNWIIFFGSAGSLLLSACSSSFSPNVDSKLVEGVDYIDHSTTYEDGKLSYDKSKWYVNELKDVPLPDPFVFTENNRYYIVGTSDRSSTEVDMYVTEDFTTYRLHTSIFQPLNFDGWENDTAPKVYAPEIYLFDGVYYMYYSALDENNIRRNSVAISTSIEGPYEPLVNDAVNGIDAPVFTDFNPNYNVLDATVFTDDDGERYIYYSVTGLSSHYIVGARMINPYQIDMSTYKVLVEPGAISTSDNIDFPLTWERLRGSHPITEGPFMIKNKGKYYLTYSVNGCWNKYYDVCYAIGNSPLGEFEKPYVRGESWTNLLLGYPGPSSSDSDLYQQWSGFASGTGHHCFFRCGDQWMIGYHAHQNRNWNNEMKWTPRYFAFDYLNFDEDGVPFAVGPTYSIQRLPEAISGYKNIAENATVVSKNVTNVKAVNDLYDVRSYNLEHESQEVGLGKGYSYIEMTFDKEYEIGGFAIYNSSYYDHAIGGAKYVDFQSGNAVTYPQFSFASYLNEETEFIFPHSAITVDITKPFKAKKVTFCFDLFEGGQINEIAILGK